MTSTDLILKQALLGRQTRFPTTPSSPHLVFKETVASTALICDCGGPLLSVRLEVLPKIHWHRKRRVRNKWAKRWRKKHGRELLAHTMIAPLLRTPSFRCSVCSRNMGRYDAFVKNIFKVEPMPVGAAVVYDRDPGV